MGRKKKSRGRRANVLSPIDKQGIKLGTLLAEAGIATQVYRSYAIHGRRGQWDKFAQNCITFINPQKDTGKLFWTGVLMKVAGKYVPELKRLGPVGFR